MTSTFPVVVGCCGTRGTRYQNLTGRAAAAVAAGDGSSAPRCGPAPRHGHGTDPACGGSTRGSVRPSHGELKLLAVPQEGPQERDLTCHWFLCPGIISRITCYLAMAIIFLRRLISTCVSAMQKMPQKKKRLWKVLFCISATLGAARAVCSGDEPLAELACFVEAASPQDAASVGAGGSPECRDQQCEEGSSAAERGNARDRSAGLCPHVRQGPQKLRCHHRHPENVQELRGARAWALQGSVVALLCCKPSTNNSAARRDSRTVLAFPRVSGAGGHSDACTHPANRCHRAAHLQSSLSVRDRQQRPPTFHCLGSGRGGGRRNSPWDIHVRRGKRGHADLPSQAGAFQSLSIHKTFCAEQLGKHGVHLHLPRAGSREGGEPDLLSATRRHEETSS
ncbi:uncharacterized protein LOC135324933 isoform X2 [Dromaius novaehollandiae]|uniref:uncharacterized protein LOC135324933 isoform X2 n=1 Tax=Dromaius novaehollandiae TaxID=8790 RepID=UPI00311E9BAD